MMREEPHVDLLHEMPFAWSDIERQLQRQVPAVYEALTVAYRVEAVAGENSWGDPNTVYEVYFDVEDQAARAAARVVKEADATLEKTIKAHVEFWDRRF